MVEDINLGKLEELFVDEIGLHRTSQNIQLILMRQTHDYSIFRTEETRELNIATLPNHVEDDSSVMRVAMLASKQKAPENRHYLDLVRTLANEEKLDDDQKECALKDNLCQKCPRCVLFGSVSTEGGRGPRFNIKHRVAYSTAYSIETYEEISELMTFNAVNSVDQSTGQALGYTENVSPLANFPSVVTLNSVTKREFIMYLKAILSCKSYGAETRLKGDVINHVVGIVGGLEEIVTPIDVLLASAVDKNEYLKKPVEKTHEILEDFSEHAVFKDQLVILSPDQVNTLLDEVLDFDADEEFVEGLYDEAETFSDKLKDYE